MNRDLSIPVLKYKVLLLCLEKKLNTGYEEDYYVQSGKKFQFEVKKTRKCRSPQIRVCVP